MPPKLSPKLSISDFEKQYWYAADLKRFAKEIKIPNSSKLRKDELEQAIKHYLKTGKIIASSRKNITKTGQKDIEKGLTRQLEIRNYTSNKETKTFILKEADHLAPGLKIKSGVWYRINRWRDEKITNGEKIKYGDLIHQFVKLNEANEKFEKIPTTLFNNFVSDYLKNQKQATRKQAVTAWEKLKSLPISKDYSSWDKHKSTTHSEENNK